MNFIQSFSACNTLLELPRNQISMGFTSRNFIVFQQTVQNLVTNVSLSLHSKLSHVKTFLADTPSRKVEHNYKRIITGVAADNKGSFIHQLQLCISSISRQPLSTKLHKISRDIYMTTDRI